MKIWSKFQGAKGLPVFIPFKYGKQYCTLYLDSKYDKYWRNSWADTEYIAEWHLEEYKPTEKDYHNIMLTIFEAVRSYDWTPPLRK
jgi:hypothetical protein